MGFYSKDKKHEYKVRLSEEQNEYITRLCKALNCNKSQAIRFIIDTVRMGEKHEH